MTKDHYPLEGVTVLDFGQVYHGPYCGFLLAMAGAHVIKIEPKTGEHLRNRGTGDIITPPFAMLNSNKKCVLDEYKEWMNDGVRNHTVLLIREDPII